ncbi:MAG: hypothetical protein KUG73_01390 [Pseudomonadales bacterium]|nr:hypothetical protein [Pseudomonadales bacterium]
MNNLASKTHHIGFKATDKLLHKLNKFLVAIEADDNEAGVLYVHYIEELTVHINNKLLLEMVEIAEISKVGRRIVNICVSSSNKVSGMLTAKIYKNKSVKELIPVAELWSNLLKNVQSDNNGDWYIIAPIENDFGDSLASIAIEKGVNSHYVPGNIDNVMGDYDKLTKTIIDAFFLEATRMVDIGSITKKMLTTGVSTVEKAIAAVFEKVIKPLEPEHFGRFVEHASQFHVRF